MKWIFFYEDEGENGENSFTIEAKDHEDAFDLAYESYGPQVNGMYYMQVFDIQAVVETKN